MARVRARDADALRALYDRHASLAYGLGLRILREPVEAAALVQDVFLHVWRQAALFDGERGYFAGWLVSLARNRAIDRVRTLRIRTPESAADGAGLPTDAAPQEADPDESAYVAELRGAVTRALGTLPATQRAALELAYFGGYSHGEIAERLDTPPAAVTARIRQGMLRLRELLGDFIDAVIASPLEDERR
jgi:RNA polymerase sigma-70 factor (ECF subfamily)